MDEYTAPKPVIQLLQRRQDDEDGEIILDIFGDAPISRNDIYAMLNDVPAIEEVELTHVLDEVEAEEKLKEFNDDVEKTPEDQLYSIKGIMYLEQTTGKWVGAYLFEDIDAWVYTFQGEDKEEVNAIHSMYIMGYEQGKIHNRYSKDELLMQDSEEGVTQQP
jgi:hypothetical protein